MEIIKPKCLILNQHHVIDSFLLTDIQESSAIISCKDIYDVKDKLRIDSIDFIIVIIKQNLNEIIPIVKYIKNSFQLIPIIALVYDNNLELARKCGSLEINKVIPINDKDLIIKTLKKYISLKTNAVKISDFNINVKEYPQLIQKALTYIEERYISLKNVGEISDFIDITESYLSQIFNKENLPSPKRLLMYCKIEHAIKLMYNEGLKLNEIANLSGFSNIYRFNDCFKNVYKKSPSEFRKELYVNF